MTFLTVAEAADILRVTPHTIRERCKKGLIPGAVKTGAERSAPWLIPDEGITAYIAALTPVTELPAQPVRRRRRRAA